MARAKFIQNIQNRFHSNEALTASSLRRCLKDLTIKKYVDRLLVLVSGLSVSRLLKVLKLASGTGVARPIIWYNSNWYWPSKWELHFAGTNTWERLLTSLSPLYCGASFSSRKFPSETIKVPEHWHNLLWPRNRWENLVYAQWFPKKLAVAWCTLPPTTLSKKTTTRWLPWTLGTIFAFRRNSTSWCKVSCTWACTSRTVCFKNTNVSKTV